MAEDIDPTKPIPNDEKFKPKNVKGPLKDKSPAAGRGKPGDTEGSDTPRGSQTETNDHPSR
jgi:hypothetical protein